MEKDKRYYYYIHPDLHYFKRFKSPYKQDISSIYKNLTEGVLMSGDPNNYGHVYMGAQFEKDREDIFHYLDKKYSNFMTCHGSRRFSEESAPLYVMKFPSEYLTGVFRGKSLYMPMPMFEKFKTTEINNVFADMDIPTFKNEFRMNPAYNLGVYSKDLGGFVENPTWSPVPDFMGYTFNKYAYAYLYKFGEKDIVDLHHHELKTKADIEKFEREIGGQIYLNHDIGNIQDMYMDIYGSDVPDPKTPQITEREILDRFNKYWDITTGLTPGNHVKDERIL